MRTPLILLLGTLAAGISLPEALPRSSKHPLSKRFIPEPRSTHLNWNVPRHELQDTGDFLAPRSNLHSVEYFTNPPALRRRLALNITLDNDNDVSLSPAKDKRAYPGRWQNMYGSCYPKYHPAPVSWGKGRQDLYYCAKDRTCQWKYKDKYGYPPYKDWYPSWQDLGGELDSPPHSCSRKQYNMHLFCKGTDGQAWHRGYDYDYNAGKGSWGNWQPMGGNMKGWPSSCSWGDKHAAVYVSSNDGQCWHRRYDDDRKGWYSWENLGGYLAGPPKSVTWGYGHTSVYCKGQDGQAWHRKYDEKKSNKWGDWEPLGGSLDSEVAACAWDGRMDMFVKGTDGKCWWKTYKDWNKNPPKKTTTTSMKPTTSTTTRPGTTMKTTSTSTRPPPTPTNPPDSEDSQWGSWESLGGDMKDGVAPEVVAVDGNMELYITGKDDQLYRKMWDAETDSWSDSWENMGGKVDTQPVAVKWDDGEGMVDVYGQGTDGTVKRCYSWD